MKNTESRGRTLQQWLGTVLDAPFTLSPITPGAGTRRYFRVQVADRSFVIMDTPVDEKCAAFIQLAKAFQALGVQAPSIHAVDLQHGFLLLTDFGSNLYGHILTAHNADQLYRHAFTALLRIQAYPQAGDYPLQSFDMVHYREKMAWFIEFYLQRYLNFPITAAQQKQCAQIFDLLIATAEQQPKTCVHYDYHCRNLIQLPDDQVGVLDFQDAVYGPVTYDLMSLLRDCYIDWPAERVHTWLSQYHQMSLTAGIVQQEDPALWLRWCDFSSAQRHIKCIGLFARFHALGHSSDYLIYIPRLINYLRDITARYAEMTPLRELLEKLPR